MCHSERSCRRQRSRRIFCVSAIYNRKDPSTHFRSLRMTHKRGEMLIGTINTNFAKLNIDAMYCRLMKYG